MSTAFLTPKKCAR